MSVMFTVPIQNAVIYSAWAESVGIYEKQTVNHQLFWWQLCPVWLFTKSFFRETSLFVGWHNLALHQIAHRTMGWSSQQWQGRLCSAAFWMFFPPPDIYPDALSTSKSAGWKAAHQPGYESPSSETHSTSWVDILTISLIPHSRCP